MKTNIKIFLISLVASFIFFPSCTIDEDVQIVTVLESTINNAQSGTWKVSKFIDSGTDETSHFSGYNFTFKYTGELNANNGSNNYNGIWSINDSNSNDNTLDDLEFYIQYNLGNDFDDLSEDWKFVSQTSTQIELIHVSGGNGGTDYLTFTKN